MGLIPARPQQQRPGVLSARAIAQGLPAKHAIVVGLLGHPQLIEASLGADSSAMRSLRAYAAGGPFAKECALQSGARVAGPLTI